MCAFCVGSVRAVIIVASSCGQLRWAIQSRAVWCWMSVCLNSAHSNNVNRPKIVQKPPQNTPIGIYAKYGGATRATAKNHLHIIMSAVGTLNHDIIALHATMSKQTQHKTRTLSAELNNEMCTLNALYV